MDHSTPDAPIVVNSFIGYYLPNADGSPPPAIDLEIQFGDKALVRHSVKVKDMRPGNFTLAKDGFELVPHHTKVTDFTDKEIIKRDYYPEVVETIKKHTGASKVIIFAHNVRSKLETKMDLATNTVDHKGPIHRCHIDLAPGGLDDSVIQRYGEDFLKVISGKWKVLNAWRPIKTVERDPLAVCDRIPEEDLLSIRRFKPDGSISEARYMAKVGKEEHNWYFAPDQTPDELLLFTQYSDKPDRGLSDRIAHSSFAIPGTEDKPPRESVEIRALVVY